MRRTKAFFARFFPELFAFALGAALTADRLLGIPGPESALLVGGLVAPALAAWTAGRAPKEGARAILGSAILRAYTTLFAAVVPLVVHAAFVPFCGPGEALLFFAYGPCVGLPLAALVGASARKVLERRGPAVAAALALTLGSIVLGVAEFWSTPGIAIFGEYAGFFPGTFYDIGVRFPESMHSYRLGSAFLAAALVLFLAASDRRARAVAFVLFLVFVAFRAEGERLGHRTSVARIDEALGGVLVGERCTLHYPREVPLPTARLHLDDCDGIVARLSSRMGLAAPPRVDVFYYRSAPEKRELMGAGQIDLAKPWRREAHLVLDRFPHPVLTHELTHVVGGELVPNLFGVPGRLGGLVPNPGLIEGFAVAHAWEERMDLEPHQAARALLELDRLPPAVDVTGLGFVRHPASAAYAAAGSFLRFVMERFGDAALSKVYAEGSIEALGVPLAELEATYRDFLRGVSLPEGAVALAATRFSRPSVFHAACPHETTSLRAKLAADLATSDFELAVETADAILAIDDTDLGVHVDRVRALAAAGRFDEAERAHAEMESRGFPGPILARSLGHLGDERWRRGESEMARAHYEAALALPDTDDAARNLEVRRYAIERGGEVESILRKLLLGEPDFPSDSVYVVHLTRALAEAGEPSLAAYLEARQLAMRDRNDAALALLSRVGDLPTQRLRREADRMRLRALYTTGRYEEARALARRLLADPAAAREAKGYLERLD